MTGVAINQMALMEALQSGACLTIDQLDGSLDLDRKNISISAGRLIRRGLVERVEAGCFQLTAEGREALSTGAVLKSGAPVGKRKIPFCRETLRQRAWNVMRVGNAFTIADLVMAAARGEEGDAANNLQRFCKRLTRAGYLHQLPVRDTSRRRGPGFMRWRLIDDTGEKAPAFRPKENAFFDFNTRETRPCQ